MNAKFEGPQHRLLNHALSCLSRYGEKLSMLCICEGEKDYVIRMSTISASQSAFCAFMFSSHFFRSYGMDVGRRRIDLQLPIRNMQAVLRTQLNKQLESCELHLIEGQMDCRLAVRLESMQGTVKTHKLTYESLPSLFPRDTPSSVNRIIASPKTIQALLDFFAAKVNGELTMTCTTDGCSLRSRGEEMTEKQQQRSLQTEVRVEKNSFATYEVEEEATLTFGLREFRAPVSLADHLQLPLEIRFQTAGLPITISIKGPNVEAQVFIATTEPDDGQAEGIPVPARAAERESGSERPVASTQSIVDHPPAPSNGMNHDVHSGRTPSAHVQPMESTPLQNHGTFQTGVSQADEARNVVEEPLFRGTQEDPPSQEDPRRQPSFPAQPPTESAALSLANVPQPQADSRLSLPGGASQTSPHPPLHDPGVAPMAFPSVDGSSVPRESRLSSLWRESTVKTFEEEQDEERRQRRYQSDVGEDEEAQSETDDSADEMPSTQSDPSAKRQRYNRLF